MCNFIDPFLQGFGAARTILVTPLFFGLAHGHHLYEYIVHQGRSLGTALFAVSPSALKDSLLLDTSQRYQSCDVCLPCGKADMCLRAQEVTELLVATQVGFQFAFTTAFGWFATFVFLRTGHLTAAVAVHAFCNLMGFPDFCALSSHPAKGIIRAAFGLGICLFCALINPLTQPPLYANGAAEGGTGNAYLHTAQMHGKGSL